MNGLKGPREEREADARVWRTCQFYYSICGAEASTEFYYKEEQRPSGSFQKKWDQGFFFPLKMSSLLFFFRQETEQLVFTKLGMI